MRPWYTSQLSPPGPATTDPPPGLSTSSVSARIGLSDDFSKAFPVGAADVA